jgi:hypothetical protein
MADFIETTNTKSATRELAASIADVATFQSIIQSVINDNLFGCTAYTQSGVSHGHLNRLTEIRICKMRFAMSCRGATIRREESYDCISGYSRYSYYFFSKYRRIQLTHSKKID